MHQLQYDTDKVKPPDWEADWSDAPLPYKLYRRLPAFPLSAEVPLTLEGEREPCTPSLQELGHFLWFTFGLTQLSQSVFGPDAGEAWGSTLQQCRRFVPSGGGLYPSELYIYLKLEELPYGVYHYDAAHHRLILLREGQFDEYVSEALGNRCDISACFGVAMVTTMFWKNYFKYSNFSYRLQGLDAGLLLGQLLEVAKRFGMETGVYFQFLDRAVNHLLGLNEKEESTYAVIPLSSSSGIDWFRKEGEDQKPITAQDLIQKLAVVEHEHYVSSAKILEYPKLIHINEASMLECTQAFQQMPKEIEAYEQASLYRLPAASRKPYPFAAACHKRYSPENDYELRAVNQPNLSTLLQEATTSYHYRNDLDGEHPKPASRVSLYGCLFGVDGVPNGAYHHVDSANALRMIRPGDHRHRLQEAMSFHNVNLFQVPLCFHVVGDFSHHFAELGYRGYRIQQMEAGMLVQRLLLAAAAGQMGGRPLLGFDANLINHIYDLKSHGLTSLIQIPVGHCRTPSRLEGSLAY